MWKQHRNSVARANIASEKAYLHINSSAYHGDAISGSKTALRRAIWRDGSAVAGKRQRGWREKWHGVTRSNHGKSGESGIETESENSGVSA